MLKRFFSRKTPSRRRPYRTRGRKTTSVKVKRGSPDYFLAGLVVALAVFGVAMVYDASAFFAYEEFGDKYWFLRRQSVWVGLGLLIGGIFSLVNYRFWKKLAKAGLAIAVLLLILVLIPGFGSEIYGSRRRLSFPLAVPLLEQVAFQPSELAKLAVILFLAAWISDHEDSPWKLPLFVLLQGVVGVLIMLEPDLGTTINLVGASMITLFLSPVSLLGIAGVGSLFVSAAVALAFSSDYRRERIMTFLNPAVDTLGISYHISQILIALGSGGLLGLGLGYSRQKFRYLPEVVTDSIFAVIGEELGFIGTGVIVIAYFVIIWRGLQIAERAPDLFGRLLAGGITALIGLQIVLNLGGMVGLVPLTGLPLPFISYGRSSLLINLVEMGILLGISRYRLREND